MAPKFGTSGLRGLVTELTEPVVREHVLGFLAACDIGDTIFIGHDLRPSSPGLAEFIGEVVAGTGRRAVLCGATPTPALALAALGEGAVMVTGSHIPADRNGLKFYTRAGEISKDDEQAITSNLGVGGTSAADGAVVQQSVGDPFVDRYVSAFGADSLVGRRIGLYAHSAVGRGLLRRCLEGLGADVVWLAPSDIFIPVDTEAVDPETRSMLSDWTRDHGLDAVVSTDGDSDRPMLTDETGRVVPGDILGQITADVLGAETVVTPISSNTGVSSKPGLAVRLTRIGSPFVIAGMEEVGGKVIGYEANGGTLLGFEAQGPKGVLPALPTRDSFLPIIAVLVAGGDGKISDRVAQEPPRFTAADRLQGIEPAVSSAFLAGLTGAERADFLSFTDGDEVAEDKTDGLRLTLGSDEIVHLRPSGNAPEFRLYVEAATQDRADQLLSDGLDRIKLAMARR